MFTGLVTDVGTIRKAEHRNGLTRFEVESGYKLEEIDMGASILHSGVCLTVVEMGEGERGAWFAVEAVPETLEKTVLGDWQEGTKVNLEQSLKLGDELGGHFVFGHVDGVGEVVSIEPEGQSYRLTIRPPATIAKYFRNKGLGGGERRIAHRGGRAAKWRLPARHHSPYLGSHDAVRPSARREGEP